MNYTIKQLRHGGDSAAEQQRLRNIFIDLMKKAKNNLQMTEHEKEFLYRHMTNSLLDDGNPDELAALDNSQFRFLYLIYFEDITGGSKYLKPHNRQMTPVPTEEAQRDLKYMISQAEKWEGVITKTNHSHELLSQSAKEARKDLKKINAQFQMPVLNGSFKHRYAKWDVLLRNKYAYHISQLIFEENNGTIILNLCNEIIEMNEYTYIHLINRHYAEITNRVQDGRSFHKREEFHPRNLHQTLQNYFNLIKNKVSTIRDFEAIYIEIDSELFVVWTQLRTKSLKGKGNITYRRFESFYPVQQLKERSKVFSKYTKINLTPDLCYWSR